MPYAPYVERLIEEHKQLSERLDKLVAFLEGETFNICLQQNRFC